MSGPVKDKWFESPLVFFLGWRMLSVGGVQLIVGGTGKELVCWSFSMR